MLAANLSEESLSRWQRRKQADRRSCWIRGWLCYGWSLCLQWTVSAWRQRQPDGHRWLWKLDGSKTNPKILTVAEKWVVFYFIMHHYSVCSLDKSPNNWALKARMISSVHTYCEWCHCDNLWTLQGDWGENAYRTDHILNTCDHVVIKLAH